METIFIVDVLTAKGIVRITGKYPGSIPYVTITVGEDDSISIFWAPEKLFRFK
jgi:hypothetical protein